MGKELEKARQFSLDHWVSISGVILNPTEAHEVLTRLLNQFAGECVREALEECVKICRGQGSHYAAHAIRTRFREKLKPQ